MTDLQRTWWRVPTGLPRGSASTQFPPIGEAGYAWATGLPKRGLPARALAY